MSGFFSNIFYKGLRSYTRFALHIYFQKIQLHNQASIPSGPVIFAANHQNAFLDAILMACFTGRQPHFLTRASVFKGKIALFLLKSLRMLPIYRFRDGLHNVKKNDQIIERCQNILSQGGSIGIFPEGNHNLNWAIRPIQKGTARIALAAENNEDFELGLKIVPVGLQYEAHKDFRSRVLVNFGEPISISNYQIQFTEDKNSALKAISSEIGKRLSEVIVDIQPPDLYDSITSQWQKYRIVKSDLYEQLQSDKSTVMEIKGGAIHATIQSSLGNSIIEKIKTVLSAPLLFIALINYLLSIGVLAFILKKFVKDSHFTGSIKFAAGMLIIPFFFILQTLVVQLIFSNVIVTGIYTTASIALGFLLLWAHDRRQKR